MNPAKIYGCALAATNFSPNITASTVTIYLFRFFVDYYVQIDLQLPVVVSADDQGQVARGMDE